MNAKEIVTKTFEKSKFGGYRIEEVDEYLKDLSVEFKKLQNENEETEKKLEVLADRIKDYRADEDALRDALLIAKKNAIQIEKEANENADKTVSDAKALAEKIETEAREKAEKTMRDADTLAARRRETSEKALAEAKAQASRILTDAKLESERIRLEMKQRTEREQIVLTRVKQESDDYLRKILAAYNAHIEYIKSIPEQCENEFVINTSKIIEAQKPEESAFNNTPQVIEPVVVEAFAPMPSFEPEPEISQEVTEESAPDTQQEEAPAVEEIPEKAEIIEEEPVKSVEEKSEQVLPTPVEDVTMKPKTDSVLFSIGEKNKDGHHSNLEFGKNIKGKK